jgi:AraC-like DNA-binding protein
MAYLFAAAAHTSGLDALRAELRRLCGSSVGGRLVCTMSSRSHSLELLPILYREAYEARKQKLLHADAVLCYDEVDASVSVPSRGSAELEELRVALRSGYRDAACAFIARVADSPWLSVPYLEQIRSVVAEETGRSVAPLEAFFGIDALVRSIREAVTGDSSSDDAPEGSALHGQPRTKEAAIVAEAKRFVLSDLSRNSDMAAAAAHVGLSYAYFSTVFKETAEVAFSDFVRQARMKEASRLLQFGHPSVGEVAKRVGYRYPKHFTRAFKQYFGVSPREYAEASQIKRGEER